MGPLDGLMGHASKTQSDEIANAFAAGERVEHAYGLIRDLFVLTDRRLILVDRQGVTGSKMRLMSLLTAASCASVSRPQGTSTSTPS